MNTNRATRARRGRSCCVEAGRIRRNPRRTFTVSSRASASRRGTSIWRSASREKNDRYQAIRHALDRRIIAGYRLWKTNYMGHDLLYGKNEFLTSGVYTVQDLRDFEKYIAHKLGKLERRLDQKELRKIFLGIYAGPVDAKRAL